MWQHMFYVSVMCSALRRELQLTNILLYRHNTTGWLLSNSMLVKLTPFFNIRTSKLRLWTL